MNLQKYAILLLSLILLIALICTNKAKARYESMQTFFNSKLLGMKIEVDATAKTQPNANITFVVSLTPEADITIKIKSFNFTVYGFINGTERVKLYTNMSNDFELTNIKHYNGSFQIPENICGITQGEIYLTYNVTMKDPLGGTHSYPISDITLSFAMTYVEDVYRKLLEEQLKNIT
ncbi:hypothetical protein KEJ32_07790, partial [Candidatus Bathyarchaeota archaeon]|nr:hypothetical protein [Candidatus Bathyarchaeota archaeon]